MEYEMDDDMTFLLKQDSRRSNVLTSNWSEYRIMEDLMALTGPAEPLEWLDREWREPEWWETDAGQAGGETLNKKLL